MIPIRFVVVNGVRYLRQSDVLGFIRDIASTEETDTRKRLDEAANNLARNRNQEPAES